MPWTLPFSQIRKDDIPLVGGKGANLGEMVSAGFPVPDGFCITAETYREMIRFNKFEDKIREILKGLDVHNSKMLAKKAALVRKLIERANIPTEIVHEIAKRYWSLKSKEKNPLVAVRSSATAEDLPEASFAGQQETYLNIRGETDVIQSVRKAWASLFEARAIFYRETQGFDHFKVALAIPIQLMVQSHTSGNIFTINPVTNNKNIVVVESVWGLGEMIVQGAVTPDHYEVNKETLELYSRVVNRQTVQLIRKGKETKKTGVPKPDQERQKLTEEQIITLAKLGMKLQQHYMFPQDIEWAEEEGKIFIVQTRPITTIKAAGEAARRSMTLNTKGLQVILRGDSASPGIATGTVRILKSAREISKIRTGDILVAPMTTPDFVPAMKRAVAIVTDKGGQTSHAAIVSRELGLPAVVGTEKGTKKLKDNQKITVNGTTGEIFAGIAETVENHILKETKQSEEIVKTATKVYVNLGEPELAGSVASKDVDGVGLLRAEFMMAQIGVHPKKMIHDKKERIFVGQLADGLEKFCMAFGYRPVIYRASDFKTNEYRSLIGGKAFEPEEANPMLGYRGAYRYITDQRVFDLELEAIKEVRNKRGHKNLHLMVPFVHTVDELVKVKRIITAAGLSRGPNFKLFMMVEIPSNVILLEQFAAVGIDGISIGSNDLTMLTLGVDRDNEALVAVYDERNPAVMWMLETAIKKATKLGLLAGICGQAPSVYPELTRKLVEWGITSISVSPDVIERTRRIVAEAEKDVVRKR